MSGCENRGANLPRRAEFARVRLLQNQFKGAAERISRLSRVRRAGWRGMGEKRSWLCLLRCSFVVGLGRAEPGMVWNERCGAKCEYPAVKFTLCLVGGLAVAGRVGGV